MRSTSILVVCFCFLSTFASDKIAADQPDADASRNEIERGQYLTTILSCGGCHTEGALLGRQRGPWLAGSKIGIAYDEDEHGTASAVIFPSNLTSDVRTGLGGRTKEEIIDILTTGVKHSGEKTNVVMPWENYRLLKPEDVAAIAAYLKSLPPVSNTIPNHISAGQNIDKSYVRFGIYLFVPDGQSHPHSNEDFVVEDVANDGCTDVAC